MINIKSIMTNYKIRELSTIALVIIQLLFKIHFPYYIAGRLNIGYLWSDLAIMHLLTLLGLVLLLLLNLIHLYIKRTLKNLTINLVLTAMIPIALFVPGIKHPYAVDYLKGFQARVENQIPVEEIQNWMATFPQNSSEQITEFERGEYPEFLSELNPEIIYIRYDRGCSENIPTTIMQWDSYLVGWGITVTLEEVEIIDGTYNSQIAPNTWIWLDEYK